MGLLIMNNKLNNKKGFALLMAIMIGSLFLAIGATIYRIALVEIILSSTGRDSQFAFYSADSGLECALFWNYHYIASGHDNSGSADGLGKTTLGHFFCTHAHFLDGINID